MASNILDSLIPSIKISTVVPAQATSEHKNFYELTNMDLAMKLHYIKAVYFFKREAVQGLTTYDFKKPMFQLLDLYSHVSGRIRKSETGRPFIKCNDAGVRIVEADCDKTIHEWFELKGYSLDRSLVYCQVLGPHLGFSPLVFMQFTWFKCGGLSVGLSWAHVLGDAFSASNFINMWGQILTGHVPPNAVHVSNPRKPELPPTVPENPISVKRVNPVGDYWVTASNCKMVTHSFYITATHLDPLVSNQAAKISTFEVLSAIIWKSLFEIREDYGPKTVTICTSNSNRKGNEIGPNNGMVLAIAEANFEIEMFDVSELAELMAEKAVVENHLVEEMVEKDEEKGDFVVYGTNLTFVNLEEANIYGLELNGRKPIFGNYSFNGVGDEGAVLVLPGPTNEKEEGGNGRIVTIVLPEKQLEQLKHKLEREWGIV
ncbi:protein ECERIFERUM 26-like [Quillaja saponaria]|uniref:Protein ECERIFERUM 26-like n=1 Tax=Quillaja saponaria TaxID=32244 RepID=A0AAD7LX34_QUISA|nr:protein ECERIFERUM 26-like [Quillaja saponaria]